MAWDNSQTFTLGLLMTPAIMTQMSANDQFLYDRVPNIGVLDLDEGSNASTTSTSFTDVGSALISLSVTINYGMAKVHFSGTCSNSTAGAVVYFDIDVDGSPHAGGDGMFYLGFESGAPAYQFSFTRIISSLTVASHTFKLRWKVSAGTAILYVGTSPDVRPQYWVEEIIQ